MVGRTRKNGSKQCLCTLSNVESLKQISLGAHPLTQRPFQNRMEAPSLTTGKNKRSNIEKIAQDPIPEVGYIYIVCL